MVECLFFTSNLINVQISSQNNYHNTVNIKILSSAVPKFQIICKFQKFICNDSDIIHECLITFEKDLRIQFVRKENFKSKNYFRAMTSSRKMRMLAIVRNVDDFIK